MRKPASVFRYLLYLLPVWSQAAFPQPLLTLEDTIDDENRTNFVSFEGLAPGATNDPTYVEDGVLVEQIDGQGSEIFSTCTTGFCWNSNETKSWYPNGGDNGFTQISLVNGADFVNFGVDIGGGGFLNTENIISYTLLQDGLTILSGEVGMFLDGYIGFHGGGFDTVQLSSDGGGNFLWSNVLAIDNIELSGPAEPGELLEVLVHALIELNIQAGISNSLDTKLSTALQALEDSNDNNDVAALNSLYALCNNIEAQRGRSLTDSQANDLVEGVNSVIFALDEFASPC